MPSSAAAAASSTTGSSGDLERRMKPHHDSEPRSGVDSRIAVRNEKDSRPMASTSTPPAIAVGVLVLAIGLESFSFRTAIRESTPLRGSLSWWGFIRRSKSPELPVVLLEDAAALLGLVFALLGVGLAVALDEPRFDGVGTLAIGLLLGVVAVILAVEM